MNAVVLDGPEIGECFKQGECRACCDSRAAPETIFDAGPGELFVLRNVGNLVPTFQPATDGGYQSARRKNSTPSGARTSPVTKGRVLTQHTGLPPRKTK